MLKTIDELEYRARYMDKINMDYIKRIENKKRSK